MKGLLLHLLRAETVLFLALLAVSIQTVRLSHSQGAIYGELEAARQVVASQSGDLAMLRQLAYGSAMVEGTFLTGVDAEGRSHAVDLAKPHAPLLLAVVNPDCPACREELPRVATSFSQRGCDSGNALGLGIGDSRAVGEFAASTNVTFPVLLESSGSAWRTLPLDVSPMLLLLEPDGRIAHVSNGLMTESEWSNFNTWLDENCQ